MRNTTAASRKAVEKFSGRISPQMTQVIIMMCLKALGEADRSPWFLDRMKAVTMTTAILANSDGWNWKPNNRTHRPASFTFSITSSPPRLRLSNSSNSSRNTAEKGSRNSGNT